MVLADASAEAMDVALWELEFGIGEQA